MHRNDLTPEETRIGRLLQSLGQDAPAPDLEFLKRLRETSTAEFLEAHRKHHLSANATASVTAVNTEVLHDAGHAGADRLEAYPTGDLQTRQSNVKSDGLEARATVAQIRNDRLEAYPTAGRGLQRVRAFMVVATVLFLSVGFLPDSWIPSRGARLEVALDNLSRASSAEIELRNGDSSSVMLVAHNDHLTRWKNQYPSGNAEVFDGTNAYFFNSANNTFHALPAEDAVAAIRPEEKLLDNLQVGENDVRTVLLRQRPQAKIHENGKSLWLYRYTQPNAHTDGTASGTVSFEARVNCDTNELLGMNTVVQDRFGRILNEAQANVISLNGSVADASFRVEPESTYDDVAMVEEVHGNVNVDDSRLLASSNLGTIVTWSDGVGVNRLAESGVMGNGFGLPGGMGGFGGGGSGRLQLNPPPNSLHELNSDSVRLGGVPKESAFPATDPSSLTPAPAVVNPSDTSPKPGLSTLDSRPASPSPAGPAATAAGAKTSNGDDTKAEAPSLPEKPRGKMSVMDRNASKIAVAGLKPNPAGGSVRMVQPPAQGGAPAPGPARQANPNDRSGASKSDVAEKKAPAAQIPQALADQEQSAASSDSPIDSKGRLTSKTVDLSSGKPAGKAMDKSDPAVALNVRDAKKSGTPQKDVQSDSKPVADQPTPYDANDAALNQVTQNSRMRNSGVQQNPRSGGQFAESQGIAGVAGAMPESKSGLRSSRSARFLKSGNYQNTPNAPELEYIESQKQQAPEHPAKESLAKDQAKELGASRILSQRRLYANDPISNSVQNGPTGKQEELLFNRNGPRGGPLGTESVNSVNPFGNGRRIAEPQTDLRAGEVVSTLDDDRSLVRARLVNGTDLVLGPKSEVIVLKPTAVQLRIGELELNVPAGDQIDLYGPGLELRGNDVNANTTIIQNNSLNYHGNSGAAIENPVNDPKLNAPSKPDNYSNPSRVPYATRGVKLRARVVPQIVTGRKVFRVENNQIQVIEPPPQWLVNYHGSQANPTANTAVPMPAAQQPAGEK